MQLNPRELAELASAVELEKKRRKYRSLVDFVRAAWPIMEGGTDYRHNWHIDIISEHLEALYRKEIQNLLMNIPPGCMKLCADSTPVPTPIGYRNHGELKVGDYVFGPDGKPTRIRAVTPKAPADYAVSFSNGEVIQCNGEHLWTVYDRFNQRKAVTKSVNQLLADGGLWQEELQGGGKVTQRARYTIPDHQELEYTAKELPIHPYFLGCWLGDGCSMKPSITHSLDDTAHLEKLEGLGYVVTTSFFGSGNTKQSYFSHQGIIQNLRKLGVFGNKHIPKEYLNSSLSQRKEMLAGLIDTDGGYSNNKVKFYTTSAVLADQVFELMSSIGWRPFVNKHAAPGYGEYASDKTAYTISATPNCDIPVALERKRPTKLDGVRRRVSIVSIEKVENPELGHCINVERDDGLYLVGKRIVVTHNSLLTSVAFPVWCWTQNPTTRFLTGSYGQDLATRDALRSRYLIESSWFQELWGNQIIIDSGQNQKTKYQNTSGGWRLATSVGGRGTGEHPDIKLVDDPHNVKEAESDTERQGALDWFDMTLSSRGVSRDARTAVIMQRLHERDLSGHIMAKPEFQSEWEHICLPMTFEPHRYTSTIGKDPRAETGEPLLWPNLFDERKVRLLSQALGEYGTAGQLQQRPAPPGGGILKTKHVQLWPSSRGIPAIEYILQSYDTAYKDPKKEGKTDPDPSACTVYGIFTAPDNLPAILLLDAWQEQIPYPVLRTRVLRDWKAFYGGNDRGRSGRRADAIMVEEKSSGISLIQDLNLANVPVFAYNPGRADKVARAHMAAPLFELDRFYVLESTKRPNQAISWAQPLIDQMEKFPNAQHDDLVDTFTQAIIYIKNQRLVELPYFENDEDNTVDYAGKKKKTNPYGA